MLHGYEAAVNGDILNGDPRGVFRQARAGGDDTIGRRWFDAHQSADNPLDGGAGGFRISTALVSINLIQENRSLLIHSIAVEKHRQIRQHFHLGITDVAEAFNDPFRLFNDVVPEENSLLAMPPALNFLSDV